MKADEIRKIGVSLLVAILMHVLSLWLGYDSGIAIIIALLSAHMASSRMDFRDIIENQEKKIEGDE